MQTTLFYKAGTSNKQYTVRLIERGGAFVVDVEYGPRGGTMQCVTKTKAPTTREAAEKVYHAAIKAKTAKGYTPGADGTPYQSPALQGRATGVLPQLCNEVEPAAAAKLLADDAWWVQEKHDGHRALVRVQDHVATGINRRGLSVPLPQPVADAAGTLDDCILDGEKVGDVLWTFDLLEHQGVDLRPLPYRERSALLLRLLQMCRQRMTRTMPPALQLVRTARDTFEKVALIEQLTKQNAEGFVLKRHAAKHTPDRPNTGGDWLKCKFWVSASVIVTGPNGDKASVGIMVLKGKTPVAIGHVTIPGNRVMPQKGDIIECRYLYAGAGGHLVQAVYLGPRDDLVTAACTWKQLKHKAGVEAE